MTNFVRIAKHNGAIPRYLLVKIGLERAIGMKVKAVANIGNQSVEPLGLAVRVLLQVRTLGLRPGRERCDRKRIEKSASDEETEGFLIN